ncbi:MAG: acyl-ACP--UDP-N-acetylglucosamine O-acyltransferase [Alphaproteobacteria bacterium]
MSQIHRTAIVEDGAKLGEGVSVGPFSVIGPDVVLGDGVSIGSHVLVTGHTEIGDRTRVSPFAVIGEAPQDTSYKGEPTSVLLGPDCIIREHVTIHRGTRRGRGQTKVGAHCFLMVGAHVAHDCVLGDHVTFVNNATVGGHVEVGEYAILGGLSAVQQKLRIGAHAFVGGHSGIGGDLIPFGIGVGRGARLGGLNLVGLRRRGFDRPTIHALRAAYREIFFGEGTVEERAEVAAERYAGVEAVLRVVEFIRGAGNRPLCTPRDPDLEED